MADTCMHHPDRPATVQCLRMGIGYCQECLDNCEACTDPCGYCIHRNGGCIIWELCRRSEARYRKEKELRGDS